MMCLLALGSAACASSGAVPRPFPGGPVARKAPAPAPDGATAGKPDTPDASGSAPADADALRRDGLIAPDASASAPADGDALRRDRPIAPNAPGLGRAVAEFALGFRGVPYVLGGADPLGFDCSGLVQYVFAQYGIDVPRVVEEQYEVGDRIDPSDLKPGDLIFFNTKRRGNDASHVAISIGGEGFVHAPNSAGVVRIETLNSSYWGSRYIGARRITSSSERKSALRAP
jgi:peptidoglycan DL-endopeptidase CwlO